MKQSVLHRQLKNGMILLGEPMPWLRSAAFSFLLPAGTCSEPDELEGLAGLTCEMVQRGCGPWDSQQFMERLDFLGIQRGSTITTHHVCFNCAMPSTVLPEAIAVYSRLVQEPHLPDSQLEDARNLCLQDLRSLDDEPSHRCFTELKRFRFPQPFGRISQGTLSGLKAIEHSSVANFFVDQYSPQGSILAVAGKFDWQQVCDLVEAELGSWEGPVQKPLSAMQSIYGSRHIDHSSSQTHFALAYECASYSDPDYYEARALVGLLSDGMSSRLFTELREKRGLVYSVFANCFSLAGQGSVLCYAGTTANRAQETLQVLLETIHSLGQGIPDDELIRLKNRIRSSLVFEQESSLARSNQIAGDWFYLGRVPDREEISQRINSLTAEGLAVYFEAHRPKNFSLVTVGSQPLEMPSKGETWN